MANVRYYTEFRSSRGDFYLLEIWDADHTGDSTRVYCDGNGFTLSHDGETDAVFSPIIGSSVTFNLYNQDSAFDTFLADILDQQEKRFYLKIYRSKYEAGDDLNAWYNTTKVVQDGMVMFATPYEEKTKYYDFFWAGFLVQDLIEQADESKPRLTSFKAADGISLLSTLDYEFPLASSNKSFKDIIIDILQDAEIDDLFTGDEHILTTIANWYADEHTYSATTDPVANTRIDLKVFTEYTPQEGRTYTNALEVIRELCLIFGARFYFDTSFRFEQISERDNTNIREWRYLKDGTQYETESLSLDVDVDQSNIYRSQGTFRYLPAVKRVSLVQQKKSAANLIGGVVRYDSSFGDETDLGVIPSANNGRILLDMRAEIKTIINTPTAGVATPVFAVTIRLEPSDGTANQYWTNQLVSGQTSFGTGSWGTTLGTYKFAGTNVSRQVSATTATIHTMATGPLPKDGEVFLDITILGLYDANGSSTSFFTGNNSYAFAVDLRSARYENDNNPASIVSSTFTATNSSQRLGSNITIDLGETRLGDGAGAMGSLYAYTGSVWTPSTGWRVGNSGSYVDIAKLVTQNILGLQTKVVRRFEGTTIQGHNFKDRLTFDTFKWIQLRGEYNANTDEYNGEWFAIAKNTALADITANPVDGSDLTGGDITDHSGGYIHASNGVLGGMILNDGTNSLGPFEETATGGEINGSLSVTGTSTLQATSVQEFTTNDRVNVTINDITATPGGSETLSLSNHFNFITYSGANGTYTINLPASEDGVILRFKTDDRVVANKTVTLQPQTGERIDAEDSYIMDRSYDGISLLGKGGNWFIIQKKEK
ncbi:MAG: hypothetical protein ACPGAG_01860 [Paracoccaceae bacterium]